MKPVKEHDETRGVNFMADKVPMQYDADADRWYVILNDKKCWMHCGEGFELYICGDQVPCRLELDHEWYVVIQGINFNLRKGTKYMVNV